MAKSTNKRLSLKPSEAEKGGSFGFPNGGVVTITEARFGTWEEAGEKALKGGRKADDPALILVGDVQGVDDPVTEFLSAGKANRSKPSDDGEYLEVAEGSAAVAVNDNTSVNIFLTSLCDKKKQGKMVLDEDDLDNGISKFLVGLKFTSGRIVPKREDGNNLDADGKEIKLKPTLIAEEILKQPSGEGGGKKKKAAAEDDDRPSRRKPVEEDEPAPSKKKAAKEEAADDTAEVDIEEEAEKLVVEVLGLPKYRKGLGKDDAFAAVYTQAKASELSKADQREVMALVEDEKWLLSKKRAWTVDDDDMLQAG